MLSSSALELIVGEDTGGMDSCGVGTVVHDLVDAAPESKELSLSVGKTDPLVREERPTRRTE